MTAEEFLTVDNPYRGMLHASPPLKQNRCEEERRPRINLNQDENFTNKCDDEGFEEVPLVKPPLTPNNNTTGVKITVNDDSDDIVDSRLLESKKWVGERLL